MSKALKQKVVGKAKPASLSKVIHGAFMKTVIPAGMASAAPPLGTMLGQRNLNIANFVKDFNEQTKNIKEGVPLTTRVQTTGDRSYILEILKPPTSYFIKQAAGVKRASMQPGRQVAGVVSIKHIYEIAKYKLDDINCAHMSLKEMCIKVINSANRAGIKVVKHDLNPDELKEFMEGRANLEKKELQELAEKKAAKMMRTTAATAASTAPKK